MVVLEHGISYKEANCPRCNAVFAYVGKDINYAFNSVHNLDDYYYYVTCPECCQRLTVDDDEIVKIWEGETFD